MKKGHNRAIPAVITYISALQLKKNLIETLKTTKLQDVSR